MTSAPPSTPAQPRSLPAFSPMWPLLATMLGGVWMGWSWFLLNSIAVGGERRFRAFPIIAMGLGVSSIVAVVVFSLLESRSLDLGYVRYILIALSGWKLGISYVLFNTQTREHELFEYYGGATRSGLYAILAAPVLRGWVLGSLIPVGWWTLVLS